MSLFTRTDFKCFVALFFSLGALFFIPLLFSLPGHLTTSARTPFCREHLPGPEFCPLDYGMLAGRVLLVWVAVMVKFLLPTLLAGAIGVIAVRWLCRRPSQVGRW